MSDAQTAGIPGAVGEPAAEQAFYFTNGGRHLFATLHAPAPSATPRGGWLFCGPFGEERGYAQRTSVEWARALSALGHWVLRFDYRGYGDSEGGFEQFTADDHVEDLLAARLELERRSGSPCVGLWGIRLGASLAVVAAARAKLDVALALWEPVVSGERYMDNLFRATMVKEMANTGRAPRTRDQLKEHMAAGGEVLIEGHPVTDAVFRSIARIDLTKLEAPVLGPAFVAQVSFRPQSRVRLNASPPPETKPRREMEALCAALGGARLELVYAPPPWQQNFEYSVKPDALFAPTLRWVEALAPRPSPAAPGPSTTPGPTDREYRTPQGGVERAVSLRAASGTLRAVLHLPAAIDGSRPAVLMVPPGFNCRTARYRLYVKTARELVQRGFVALRIDPHGIGDSDGTLEYPIIPDYYNAVESGLFVEDTRAALGYLESELGIGSAFVIGLCGGATTSVRVGALDARVAGIIASELPLLFTPKDQTEEEQAPAPVARAAADHFLRSYARKLFDAEAWRRFFTMKSDYRRLATSLRVAIAKRLWPRRTTADEAWFRERLGPRANLSLVGSFQGCLARRIPLLCLFGATRNSWYFSEIWPGLLRSAPGAGERVRTKSIEDADPGFSLPPHTREFLETVVSWAEAHAGARDGSPARTAHVA